MAAHRYSSWVTEPTDDALVCASAGAACRGPPAVAEGTTTITTVLHRLSGTTALRVSPPALAALAVEPANPTVDKAPRSR